ncbi:spore coat-associated protein N [Cytobacillus horneckiae]|uniref:Cell division protein FtsN n=1 Tax=Cytobacillus horneckiae TaxID=549687 RepID=A0A2N0ZHS9_9BACI|nr:CalY family protein [Cytobacillus horneckiae]MBN6886949.1 M73 family metallopeptidase [Cytobacillus horneckiae]MCM3177581.1 CalY family protein [Cytobacillus horneckiae]MEC1157884.1 CalY family protein [Cytobacillus horneckiae]MED2937191.1 CalY family protein [Cytobacillus horneckiae]PKG29075.1 cell division protein FtsN [Cytobacillus horneckiae]
MGIKKKLGMGVASAALGIALIGGGTFAYFSDSVTTQNTFAAGTLDLSVNPEAIVHIENIKPGDSVTKEFVLGNNGSLNIANINLITDYTVADAANNNVDDFGKHIRVNFLWNWDKESEPIFETTLYDLKNMDPDVVKKDLWDPFWQQNSGLAPGDTNELWVQFEFIDNGEDQNQFQGDNLSLQWTFNATQGDGEDL